MQAGAEPTLAEVQAFPDWTLLEFGASWCGYCQAARPLIDAELSRYPQIRRLWVEDAKGRPLGRAFGIKLWPTLVLLQNGRELRRVVRPSAPHELEILLQPTAGRQDPVVDPAPSG